jgi:phytoene/squalene synthetase
MKQLFDDVSFKCSKLVTKTIVLPLYGICLPSIRDAIYSIYGFVRFADEIVDSFHGFNKEELINDFEKNIINHLKRG